MTLELKDKEKILGSIFDITDKMTEIEKNYVLGYIRGFEDRANLDKFKNVG